MDFMPQDNDLLWYAARGGSMFPFICAQDFILVKRTPLDAITPGDVILFESEDKAKICHSVASVKKSDGVLWFFTRGFRGISYDSRPIRQDRILGKVLALKRKNKVIDLTKVDIRSFRFRFNCFLVEWGFYTRSVLAKLPGAKAMYKYMKSGTYFLGHRSII